MSEMIWDESGLLFHYLSDKLENKMNPANGGFIILDKGKMIGAVATYNHTMNQASIVGASESPRWFTKKNVTDLASMFFHPAPYGMGLTRLNSFISVENPHSISITKRIGFVEEGLMRQAGPDGEDVVVLGLLANECPWLQPLKDDPANPLEDTPAN
jgi:RimJ/RimL family protein N-acetyltransferase